MITSKPSFAIVTRPTNRVFALLRKKPIVYIIAIFMLLSITLVVVFYLYETKKAHSPKIVVIQGKKYVAGNFTSQSKGADVPSSPEVYLDEAKKLEAEVASLKVVPYEKYLSIAQLYQSGADYSKAISNYELAKKAASPSMKNYQEVIKSLDETIKNLKESV